MTVAKSSQRLPKVVTKVAQGSQREPKGAKGSQKGAKGSQRKPFNLGPLIQETRAHPMQWLQ